MIGSFGMVCLSIGCPAQADVRAFYASAAHLTMQQRLIGSGFLMVCLPLLGSALAFWISISRLFSSSHQLPPLVHVGVTCELRCRRLMNIVSSTVHSCGHQHHADFAASIPHASYTSSISPSSLPDCKAGGSSFSTPSGSGVRVRRGRCNTSTLAFRFHGIKAI